ncbi:hypothetical protein [Phyllobacterium myrsinacearum]|uniref:Uncharacterized protein n=1 Tax=Phyllobacterium myrsinacearum TaxID=28101 RepID=A0A839EXN3_9HYPH|nr:hypothetical protein [Phyllobacterium myrsinacearum]MBA8882036.1 hypothetical protein [Phyllobacterium myrsinacearum]
MKSYVVVPVVALIALVGYFTYLPISFLLISWDNIDIPTVQKRSQLELARSGSWIQNGSLRLICSKRDNSLHLVQFTHLAGEKPSTFFTGTGSLLVSKAMQSPDFTQTDFPDTTWYPERLIDIMVTPGISEKQLSGIAKVFNANRPLRVIFGVGETAKGFTPVVDGNAVENMGRQCLDNNE